MLNTMNKIVGLVRSGALKGKFDILSKKHVFNISRQTRKAGEKLKKVFKLDS